MRKDRVDIHGPFYNAGKTYRRKISRDFYNPPNHLRCNYQRDKRNPRKLKSRFLRNGGTDNEGI